MGDTFQMQDDDTNYNGWRFCQVCQNLLIPLKGNVGHEGQKETIVQFKCNSCSSIQSARKGGMEVNVNVNIDVDKNSTGDKEKLLMKRTVLERTKAADIFNRDMVLDDAMQRKQIQCPVCKYHEAVYYLKTDNTDPQIIIQYICARGSDEGVAECAYTWNKLTQLKSQQAMEQEEQYYEEEEDKDIDFSSDEEMREDKQQAQQYEQQIQDDDADLFDDDEQMD